MPGNKGTLGTCRVLSGQTWGPGEGGGWCGFCWRGGWRRRRALTWKCHKRAAFTGELILFQTLRSCVQIRSFVRSGVYSHIRLLTHAFKPNALLLVHTVHFLDGFECSIPCLKWRRGKKRSLPCAWPMLELGALWLGSRVHLALGSYADHSTFCLLSPALFIWRIPDSQITFPFAFSPAHSHCTQIWDSQQADLQTW